MFQTCMFVYVFSTVSLANFHLSSCLLHSFLSPRLEDLESMPEEKALMVVKRDPLFLRTPPPPPCQPPVNRTKCIKSVRSVLKLLRFSSTHYMAKSLQIPDHHTYTVMFFLNIPFQMSGLSLCRTFKFFHSNLGETMYHAGTGLVP